MGLFFKSPKPKFNLVDFLFQHLWEVGFAAGLILILALLLCRCLSSDNKLPRTLSMEELIEPPTDSDTTDEDDDDDSDEEEVITPRRSARLRNKRLSHTI